MKNKINFYKDIILRISENSECLSGTKVGAVITLDNRIIAEGWNSPPKKCNAEDCYRCNNKHESGKNIETILCQHAEQGAIATAAYAGISLKKGAELYCTHKPCSSCATLIVHSGIKKIYYINDYVSVYTDIIFKKAGIKCLKIE